MLLKKIEEAYNKFLEMLSNFDSRLFAVIALICILVSAVASAFSNDQLAESSAVYAYFALVAVVVVDTAKYLYELIIARLAKHPNIYMPIKFYYKKYIGKAYNTKLSYDSSRHVTSAIISTATSAATKYDQLRSNLFTNIKSIYSLKYFFLLYVLIAVVLPWIIRPGYLFFVDYVSGPNLLWADMSQPSAIISNTLLMLGYVLGNSIVQKLFVTLVIWLVLYSGYRIGGNAIAIAALFNPFVYDRLAYGQFYVVLGYALLLLIIAKFADDYQKLSFKMTSQKAVLFGVLYGLSIISSPHYIFISGLFVFAIFLSVYEWPERGSITLAYFTAPILAINSVWIYNNIFGKGELVNFVSASISNYDFELFKTIGNGFWARTITELQLMGFWGSATGRYLDIAMKPLYFWPSLFILIGVGYGLFLIYKRTPHIAKLLFGLIVAVLILAQGTSILLLKTFLYEIPFYSGLREPQKWIALLTGIYLFSLSVFVRDEKKYYAAYITIVASVLWTPYILLGLWGQIKPINYPEYWSTINQQFVNSRCYNPNNDDSKILVLPWHLYTSYSWTQKVSANPAAYYFDCDNLLIGSNMELGNVYDNSGNTLGTKVSKWVQTHDTLDLPSNVQAILLFKDVDWKDYNFIPNDVFPVKSEYDNYIIYSKF